MIPSAFIHLQNIPLTSNGKVDQKALPLPNFENENSYIAPRTKQEKIVCEAFSKVLGIRQVGINSDFFSLGGNSIQAIKLISILQENFGMRIADIFNLRTPLKLAKCSIFGKNFLQHKLKLIKDAYLKKCENEVSDTISQIKLNIYNQSCMNLPTDILQAKPIQNVLLTGAT